MPRAAGRADRRMSDATGVYPSMVEWRRRLHCNPEVGIVLSDTQLLVAVALSDLGIDAEVRPGGGVSTRILGQNPDGVTSVLPTDMDGLPLQERSGESFASERDGAMHACGRDLHTAMLVDAAQAMTATPPRRDTVLVFQPGEESDHGALQTLLHQNLTGLRGASAFAIEFASIGGHASSPHLTGDPIDAAADTIREMPSLAADLALAEHMVATVAEIVMGNTVNVIPDRGRLRGTIRALSTNQRDSLIAGIEAIVQRTADRVGVTGALTLIEGYPAVVNDPGFVEGMLYYLSTHELADRLREMPKPSMVIEDFAYFLQQWPRAMVYLGANVTGHSSFNHSDHVVFDESAMVTGAARYMMAAEGFA